MVPSDRACLRWASALALGLSLAAAAAARAEPRHGISTFGELKYRPDFKHFDYVNPDAPKGGRIITVGTTTFDTFNAYILKGDKPLGLELLVDTLMERAADEPDSYYGLVAASADLAADRRSITFKLRPEARFSDGSQVTADDVAFSFEVLKEKGFPTYAIILRDVVKAQALDKLTVRFSFQGELLRDLPLLVAGLPVLSKAYYSEHRFEDTTLKPPVGSGPYRIAEFTQGTFVLYRRRDDYWAKDLPVNRGRWNFDEIRFDSFRDRGSELEALKSGHMDLREEFTAKDWVTSYDIAAVKDGRLQRATLPDETPSGTQGFFMNTRREKLADPRVRRALDLAFDYEWTNRNLFFSLYTRTESYFENSEMKAKGPPGPEELALLESFRAKLPPSVFGEPYLPPRTDGSGNDRRNLREAQKLLAEAGWKLDPASRNGAVVRNARGQTLDIELLIDAPTFERILGPYIRQMQAVGINAMLRRVDSAQYQRRVKSYDFDIVVSRFIMSLTPGVELRNYMSSAAARSEGSRNLAGIADPVVDALIAKAEEARSRAELVVASRAIDRVLRANHYWVSHWYKASHHVAHWNKFDRPPVKPRFGRGILDTWWYDARKAGTLRPN
jgi:microcin C transport system substrate-binding protein